MERCSQQVECLCQLKSALQRGKLGLGDTESRPGLLSSLAGEPDTLYKVPSSLTTTPHTLTSKDNSGQAQEVSFFKDSINSVEFSYKHQTALWVEATRFG